MKPKSTPKKRNTRPHSAGQKPAKQIKGKWNEKQEKKHQAIHSAGQKPAKQRKGK